MRRPLFLITAFSAAAAGALLIATAMPAAAATSALEAGPGSAEGTPVTFEVTTGGTLGITVPDGPVDLGTGAVGTTIGTIGDFGDVTVTDNRGVNPASWTAAVYSTSFVNSVTPADVIPVGDATYLTGAVTATPGQTPPSWAALPYPSMALRPSCWPTEQGPAEQQGRASSRKPASTVTTARNGTRRSS
jgi:hypothetical protein